MIGDPGGGEQIIRRARRLAVGIADTGLSGAEEMLRRISPEGRAQARRERAARARRRMRLLMRLVLAALASLLVLAVLAQFTIPGVSVLVAAIMMVLLSMLILSRAAPRIPGREAPVGADLAALPSEASLWLAAQRRALPAPAVRVADLLDRHLNELAPQLARLDPRDDAADAVRMLIATELPGLIDGWRGVPPSLRTVPRMGDPTPDAQLIDGLTLIDAEVQRMTGLLARGAIDEVATQRRYLELKYRGGPFSADDDAHPP